MHQLGVALSAARRHKEAIPLLDDTLTRKKAKNRGAADLSTLKTMDALAIAYRADGQLKAAIPLFEDELKLCRQVLTPDHSHTQTCMNNAALAFQDVDRLPEAIALYEENLKLKRGKIDPDHPNLATALHNLAWGYQAANRFAEAVPLYQEALRIRRLKIGASKGETLTTLFQLANGLELARRISLGPRPHTWSCSRNNGRPARTIPTSPALSASWAASISGRSASRKPNRCCASV